MTLTQSSASDLADQRTRQVLLTQPSVQQLVIDSPPGAGKTGVAERVAVQGAWLQGEKVMIATQTKAQSLDLVERLASGWPSREVYLFAKQGMNIPDEIKAMGNAKVITSLNSLPNSPHIVVANAAKWSYAKECHFDLLIVDEAYQLRDSQFIQIAGLATRHVLVGDPGQIAPVVSADVSQWRNMPDGPQVPAPQALLARRPDHALRMTLPSSRRLPADTVDYVQPAFYPQLPFTATSRLGDRLLLPGQGDSHRWDEVIDKAGSGATLLMAELPARSTGEFDDQLSAEIAGLALRLLERGTEMLDDGQTIALTPQQIGVVCAHRSQVYSVQQRLGKELEGVYVETADRYQGLERRVMIAHHPLSGRMTLSDFQLDSGRLCVMTSRHRVCCFLLARAGLAERLGALSPSVERVLGLAEDPAHQGRYAHRSLLQKLSEHKRIVPVSLS